MGYAKEFNHENYTIPAFITNNSDWQDVSWHNDVCPRWENGEIGLAVWVDADNLEMREFDDWKRLTIVRIVAEDNGCFVLADDTDYTTDDDKDAERWIRLFQVKTAVEAAQYHMNQLEIPIEDLADELATVRAILEVQMQDREIPDCSPSGERM